MLVALNANPTRYFGESIDAFLIRTNLLQRVTRDQQRLPNLELVTGSSMVTWLIKTIFLFYIPGI